MEYVTWFNNVQLFRLSKLSVTTSTSKIQVLYCMLALYPDILYM